MDNSLAAFSSNPRYSPDGLEVEIEKEELELARKTDSEQTAIADLQSEAPKVETQEGFDMLGMHEKILGVVDNATRVPRDIVGGITKAIDNTMSFAIGRENVDAANQWLQEEIPDLVKITSAFEKGHAPVGTVSEVTQELSQFAIPFGAYMKGLKALSVAGGVEAGAFTTGFLSDVITSGTALDPHIDRLAAMAKEMGVDNKIVGWLADNENETDSEGRLKNILENAGLGVGMAAAITATVLPLKGMWRLSKEIPNMPRSPSMGSPQAQRGSISLKDTKTKEVKKSFADTLEEKHNLEKLNIAERDDSLVLNMISVKDKKQGVGTKAMQDIINYADEQGKRIELTPEKIEGTTSKARLINFYKKFGFVENKGKNLNPEISESMYRETK